MVLYRFLWSILLAGSLLPNTAKAQSPADICGQNGSLKASYELAGSWIYICAESEQEFLLQVDKNENRLLLKVPAAGGFPTFAAVEGDLSDPDGKIYNISPFDFKIVQGSIITLIEPVRQAIEHELKVVIAPLGGSKKENAIAACQIDNKEPVQVFETVKSTVYICIEGDQNDPNAIQLSYIEKLNDNLNESKILAAELVSSFHYQTSTQDHRYHVVSYRGLDTYQDGIKIDTQPVTNVYLAPPDLSKNAY